MKKNNIKSKYSINLVTEIDNKVFQDLKILANNDKTKRSRILLHSNEKSRIHEMLIFFNKNSYIRPHKHLDKIESYLVLEGELDLIYFNDYGEINNKFQLSNINSGKHFFLRSENDHWHTILIKSEYVILLETTNGPLNTNSTIFAEWSPDSEKEEIYMPYLNELKRKIDNV